MAYKPKPRTKPVDIEAERKKDALALAKLILDIYEESKIKVSPNNDKE